MTHLGDDGHALDFLHVEYAYQVLSSPSIWIGAAAGVAMIAGAIWLRRWRDDS
jgi:ABC-2 type transport system permease protein